MIVEAKVKRVNIDKDKARIDVFNPRFKFRSLISLHIQHEGKVVKFFTEWSDIKISDVITINGTKISKDQMGDRLVRGMVVCCEGDDTIYVHMPEQLIG